MDSGMKNQNKPTSKILLSKAHQVAGQQVMAAGVVLVLGLMFINAVQFPGWNPFTFAGNSNTSTLSVNVTAGTLEIVNVQTAMNFGSLVAGTGGVNFENLDNSTVRDFRASPVRWNLRGYSAPLVGAGDGNYQIANTAIWVWPGNADKTNVETFNTEKVGNGTDNSALNDNVLIFNSSHNAAGVIRFDNLLFRLATNSSLTAQDYSGSLTVVVI
ncbi:MAG: hypothetical protein VE98_C0001G0363 [candidate division Kazan bacterium GW2011_GWA1_50_15]|uniref:Uncharacterized protein n=2 Tax=Bacteria division Kazan-3B-28 TaxID=1798534 RepID=A0A0G4BB70_UNCK3|nr:MAG: hypothetical protein VE98_C0001G0363 [candidate division Kazan bacterium GW2011_GWA1_50_15]